MIFRRKKTSSPARRPVRRIRGRRRVTGAGLPHLEQFAREEEQARDIKLNLNVADGRGSQSAQNEQVDRFLSQGYDVMCVNIVDRTAAAVISASKRSSR